MVAATRSRSGGPAAPPLAAAKVDGDEKEPTAVRPKRNATSDPQGAPNGSLARKIGSDSVFRQIAPQGRCAPQARTAAGGKRRGG